MTDIHNLTSILTYGLLSHNEAHQLDLVATDISNQSVQYRRGCRQIGDIPLHSYVCLYFSPRNPMLYVRREHQDEIVFIGVNPNVLLLENTIFSDGNAASESTSFYRGTPLLDELPWDIINAAYWKNHQDGKRIKCAEILVHPKVDVQYLIKIFCISVYQAEFVRRLIPAQFKIPVEVNTALYF